MGGIVLFLRHTCVVESEIRKIRGLMASRAIAGVLRTIASIAGSLQENLEPCQLRRAKLKWERMVLKAAHVPIDPKRIAQPEHSPVQALVVRWKAFPGIG